MSKLPLVLVIGPTAVGKTKLSVRLARAFDGEIISGDSMQIYRGMDIGTAKITEAEAGGIPHHLIDILDPDDSFSAAQFQQLAAERIEDIHKRSKLPFIVGGTGLYLKSLTHSYEFSDIGGDEVLRQRLTERADAEGKDQLYAELVQKDSEAARHIHPNNVRRVIRALEVIALTGQRFSDSRTNTTHESSYDCIWIGLNMDRELLYERINRRVDIMVEMGLMDEVAQLLDAGYSETNQAMQGIGYKEIAACLREEMSKEAAVELLKQNTRHFAKRQLTWFRRMPEIHWFDVTDSSREEEYFLQISAYLAGKLKDNEEYSKN